MGGCGWKWHTCLFFVISPCGVCIKHEVFNFGGGNIFLSVLLKCFLLPSLSANNTLIIICSFRWLDIRQPLVCFTPLGKRFVCSFVDKLCKVNNLFYISQIIWRLFLLHFCCIFQDVCLFADKKSWYMSFFNGLIYNKMCHVPSLFPISGKKQTGRCSRSSECLPVCFFCW